LQTARDNRQCFVASAATSWTNQIVGVISIPPRNMTMLPLPYFSISAFI
jgi:hypothetical protein